MHKYSVERDTVLDLGFGTGMGVMVAAWAGRNVVGFEKVWSSVNQLFTTLQVVFDPDVKSAASRRELPDDLMLVDSSDHRALSAAGDFNVLNAKYIISPYVFGEESSVINPDCPLHLVGIGWFMGENGGATLRGVNTQMLSGLGLFAPYKVR